MCSPGQSPRDTVLAELAATDPAALPAPELMEHVAWLAGFIGAAQGELARLAAALDGREALADHGHASAAGFLRTRCGLAPARASEIVATGRELSHLPAAGQALAAGNISFDQAAVTARTAAAITKAPRPRDAQQQAAAHEAAQVAEQILADAAAAGVSVAQLRQLGEETTYRADPEAAEERERRRFERRYLSFGLTLDGTGTINGACGDTLTYESIRTAAEAFGPPGGHLDTRTAAQRRLDGLAAACRTALDASAAPIRHRAAPHISVLVHDHTLRHATRQHTAPCVARPGLARSAGTCPGDVRPGGTAPGSTAPGSTAPDGPRPDGARPDGPRPDGADGIAGAATGPPPGRTGHGQMLTGIQILALCCGAELTAIHWEDGLPLDIGRAARTEPPALRKALEARDRTCRWPGCQAPGQWCTGHHIPGWAHRANTSLTNMCLLCHFHHSYFIHQAGWTITGNPNELLQFTSPDGHLTLDSPLPGKTQPPRQPRAP